MPLRYPSSRRDDTTDSAAGLLFPDPYRWLEEETDEVRGWQRRQNATTAEHAADWPHTGAVRTLVERCMVPMAYVLPREACGHWFRTDAASTRVLVSAEPYGAGRVLLDVGPEAGPGRTPVVSWLSPSPDGQVLAVGVCDDGSERNTIRLLRVDTGELLPGAPTQVLNDAWTGGAAWLRDSSGFFFTAVEASAEDFRQDVHFHRVGGPTERVALPVPPSGDGTVVQLSHDGRWAVAAHGGNRTTPVAVSDLRDPNGAWRPFVTRGTQTIAGHPVRDGYVAVTDEGASRGRLVRIPLDATDPDDRTTWQELVPESDAVLRSVTPIGDHLYLWELVDTYSRLRITDLDGTPVGQVALPGRGTVHEWIFPLMALLPRGSERHFVFGFSTPTISPGVYSHDPRTGELTTLAAPQVQLDATVEDASARSADGTLVPFQVVRPAGAPQGPGPTLVYAYGGLDVPLLPQWAQGSSAFVAAGGVRVLAHLRGGGEFGRDWWEGGRLKHKTKGYEDLSAIAEELVARGIATPASLAVQGGSNGGLMAAVAVAQRPDLWAAAVSQVPLTDLVGALRNPYTRAVIVMEMADPEDPDEVRRLASFSPYHLVRDGEHYPAVLLEAGANDTRCPPWHARKLAARLQAAQAGHAPVLLRVWEGDGHGWATDEALVLEQQVHRLSFLMRHTGLTPGTSQTVPGQSAPMRLSAVATSTGIGASR